MTSLGIVCEYNPFHQGHKYHISSAKTLTKSDFCVCVMSGNFVQRGAPAIADKWTRAKMAVENGADLVLELPTPYATSSAEDFAAAAIFILNQIGCVTHLSFGCESDNTNILSKIAEELAKEDVNERIRAALKTGISYPAARDRVLTEIDPEFGEIIRQPNNILAVEYIKALKELGSDIKLAPVLRHLAHHHSNGDFGGFKSATFIRSEIEKGNFLDYDFTPRFFKNVEQSLLYKIRITPESELESIKEMAEGVHLRIKKGAITATTYDELIKNVQTKRYTLTRINRILLNILLDIKKGDFPKNPPYTRALAFNKNGEIILKKMKETSQIPVIIKPNHYLLLDGVAKGVFEREITFTNIYNLCGGDRLNELTHSPIRI